MFQNVKQTKRTVRDKSSQTISPIMQVLFALIQIFLIFRLALRLLGANASNFFVNIIYEATAPLVGLFEGIFSDVMLEESTIFTLFEPATVITIIVTAAVAYVVLRLVSVKQEKKTEHIEVQEQANAIPLGQVSEAQMEQTDKNKLENESQELEERIRHQQQMLDDHRAMYGNARDENKSAEHQRQILENQRKMDDIDRDKNKSAEHLYAFSDEVPVYEKRRSQI